MHVYMSRDTPMPIDAPNPSAPSPELQGAQLTESPESPEIIEIIRFCLKNLYL